MWPEIDNPTNNTGEYKMSYVDGFIAAVPTEKKDKYIAHAKVAADVFKEYGALKIV